MAVVVIVAAAVVGGVVKAVATHSWLQGCMRFALHHFVPWLSLWYCEVPKRAMMNAAGFCSGCRLAVVPECRPLV